MPSEYCPFCRTAANMKVTVLPQALVGKDANMKAIDTKTYHCESCGSFVRGIDEEKAA